MEKILVVDDQPEIRRLLAVTLRRSFDVQFATDGAAALQSIRESRPRAVLLDIMMPGEPDGLGVLAAIKSDPDSRGIPVGMLTARGQQADQQRALGLGADAYFRKPFSPLAVLEWVNDRVARADAPAGRAHR